MTLLATVGAGSNLGLRLDHLASAAAVLRARGVRLISSSRVFRSDPVGVAGVQPEYLNAAWFVEWAGSPEGLLDLLLDVEAAHGRARPPGGGGGRPDGARGGAAARTLDLDLLAACDDRGRPVVRSGGRLTLPHPRMAERAFVQKPLADLAERSGSPPLPPALAPVGTRADGDAGRDVRPVAELPLWPDDAYREDTVAAGLPAGESGLGSAWRFLAETASTNEDARRWAAEGAPHGAVVLADAQTAGRGRHGRSWSTPPGAALALSLVLRTGWGPERMSLLPLAAGIAVARALEEEACLRPGLKWPNDTLVNGRKIAGILAEVVGGGTVILGIGANLNWPLGRMDPELRAKATSVLRERGGPISRPVFARALLSRLDAALASLARSPDAVVGEWRRRSVTLGREARVRLGDRILFGLARDVAPDGGLVLRTAAGDEVLHAGEVTLDVGESREASTARCR